VLEVESEFICDISQKKKCVMITVRCNRSKYATPSSKNSLVIDYVNIFYPLIELSMRQCGGFLAFCYCFDGKSFGGYLGSFVTRESFKTFDQILKNQRNF
jgi:hypothetical protein